jgi:hypothetical protein
MTKTRMFMVAALAVIVAFGVSGLQAQNVAANVKLTPVTKVPTEGVSPDAAPAALIGGELGMGVIPPIDGSGYYEWPCFTGGSNPDCSGIPAGGWVSGIPFITWSKTGCKNTVCAQLTWWFADNTTDATDDLIITITAKQGSKTLLNSGALDFGPNPFAGGYLVVLTDYVAFGTDECATGTCKNPAAGDATLTAEVQVGTAKATTKTIITFQ